MLPSKQMVRLYKSQFRTAFLEVLNKANGLLSTSDVYEVVSEIMDDISVDLSEENIDA